MAKQQGPGPKQLADVNISAKRTHPSTDSVTVGMQRQSRADVNQAVNTLNGSKGLPITKVPDASQSVLNGHNDQSDNINLMIAARKKAQDGIGKIVIASNKTPGN